MILHAGVIAVRLGGAWRGVMVEGPSGAGKSDLALRAMDAGFRLVADDYAELFVSRGDLFAKAPSRLRDLIEIRGVGVVRQSALSFAKVALAVRCKMEPGAIERLPEPHTERFLGIAIPAMDLWSFEDSAPAKIRRAIEYLGVRS